jgi:hypothetical protein
MMQKQNALIGVANSSATRAEAHCIVVAGRNGTCTRLPHRVCSAAAVCAEATIK